MRGEGIADGGAAGVPQSHLAIHVARDDPVPALEERRDGGGLKKTSEIILVI